MKIFVMGMHRSGTSMVTGILKLCGMNVGNNLLMGARDNPKGHFEDRRFLNINNDLLIKNGGKWHNPPINVTYQKMRNRMLGFLELPEWKTELVGWKDPRSCITFPLWHRLIYPEKIKVVYVYRPIQEIARSLKVRNGIKISKGWKLGGEYARRAFEGFRGTPGVSHFITYYHSYFHDWEIELEELCEFLGMKIPGCEKKRIQEFITPELRHHKMKDPYVEKGRE